MLITLKPQWDNIWPILYSSFRASLADQVVVAGLECVAGARRGAMCCAARIAYFAGKPHVFFQLNPRKITIFDRNPSENHHF